MSLFIVCIAVPSSPREPIRGCCAPILTTWRTSSSTSASTWICRRNDRSRAGRPSCVRIAWSSSRTSWRSWMLPRLRSGIYSMWSVNFLSVCIIFGTNLAKGFFLPTFVLSPFSILFFNCIVCHCLVNTQVSCGTSLRLTTAEFLRMKRWTSMLQWHCGAWSVMCRARAATRCPVASPRQWDLSSKSCIWDQRGQSRTWSGRMTRGMSRASSISPLWLFRETISRE